MIGKTSSSVSRNVRKALGLSGGLALVVLAAMLVGCGGGSSDDGDDGGSDTAALSAYLSQVTSSDGEIAATRHSGNAPEAASSAVAAVGQQESALSGCGPVADASSTGATLPGGSKIFSLVADDTFTDVYVLVDGVDGYYLLEGLSSAALNTIVVSIGQDAPDSFTIKIAVAAGGAAPCSYTEVPVTLTQVGTGDIQVSLTWDVPADIDLHVVDPAGDDVYYGADIVASGGTLDLDSNASCDIDDINNENVTWASGTAPSGEYIVRVDNWDSCGESPISYVVTIHRKGHAIQTFSGTFTDAGDEGGAGSGVEITSFTF